MTTNQLVNTLVLGGGLVALVGWLVLARRARRAAHRTAAREIDSSSNNQPAQPAALPTERASVASLSGLALNAESRLADPESLTQISLLLADVIGEAQTSGTAVRGALATSAPVSGLFEQGPDESRVTLFYEADAEDDEPTAPFARIEVAASGDSDCGLKRRRNEDSFLVLPEQGVFVVADGMGGHAGGQVASSLAVDAVRRAFESERFEGAVAAASSVPRRGQELVNAVWQANRVVFSAARSEPELADMGTTLVALRFAPNKQRLYVGHVGDSRCYRLRGADLRQLTTDHVMAQRGLKGPRAGELFNAVGLRAELDLDLVVDMPRPGDVYLLCSDGLPKMVSDEVIRDTLIAESDLEAAVYSLIERANDAGGKDNVTVLLAKVLGSRTTRSPSDASPNSPGQYLT